MSYYSNLQRWLSSGMLRRVVWWKFTDVLELLPASIIREMSKPRARTRFEIRQPVGQARTLAGPMGKKVRIGSQW
jgi:hypothetical protein